MLVLRVLVVDDNDEVANAISLLLCQWGHESSVARDGPEALAVASEFRPDVAILDLGLPRMDGHEVGRRLREVPGLDGLTLLAMTGYADEEHERRCKEAGFAAHFIKPADLSALEALLNVQAAETERRARAP